MVNFQLSHMFSDSGNGQSLPDCFNQSKGSTVLQGLNFGGVPVVLLIDFVCFWVLLLIFSIIRKRFWDYGRLALVSESNAPEGSRYKRLSSSVSVEEPEYDKNLCSWLAFVFQMNKEKIQERCGIDAVHYLNFQRHLIFLLVIFSILSVAVILPVNLSGKLLEKSPFNFGRTTIGNLASRNNLLWLHTVFAVLYLIATFLALNRHKSQMDHKEMHQKSYTLFITSVPKQTNKDMIFRHISEAYPSVIIVKIDLCYDAAKLICLYQGRKRAKQNLIHYRKLFEKEGKRASINPRPCCCFSMGCCKLIDAIDYYSVSESKLEEEYDKERNNVTSKPLGMAFVTLQNEAMANLILQDFNAITCNGCECRHHPNPSTVSQELQVNKWSVTYEPDPHNIYWENISIQGITWWSRYLGVNFVLFLLLFFLTTPSIIISTMDKFNVTLPIYYLHNAVISQFFPTLLLWMFSALLPTIVYYSTILESHWTRSNENQAMMNKLYFFLLFMVLILPSLGFTSLDYFFRWLFDTKFLDNAKVRFECVFLPDQGAFFVNYVIASAFIGTGMELLRLPSLFLYLIRMAVARSAAERKYVKHHQAYEFEYGAMYAWTLCTFTVIVAYSITCPVIVPFGLIYMLLKHLVDKHNLYFAYLPAKLDKKIHYGAIKQAMAAPIICLFWLYFFSVIRSGFLASTSLFTFIVLCIVIFLALSYTCFENFKYLSPHNYEVKESSDKEDMSDGNCKDAIYAPEVLHKPNETTPLDHQGQTSYGTTEGNPSSALDKDEAYLLE
ncbi:CSC1-like protein 1 isoform X1 [Polypterus senegalus]|nr:CSC1-like protein 1 isoform X1 [Polypterus senegalus]